MPEVLSQQGWQSPEGVPPERANMTLLELADQLQVWNDEVPWVHLSPPWV